MRENHFVVPNSYLLEATHLPDLAGHSRQHESTASLFRAGKTDTNRLSIARFESMVSGNRLSLDSQGHCAIARRTSFPYFTASLCKMNA